MKLLDAFRQQVRVLGPLRRAWFTTFNLGIPFFETHVLPELLQGDADPPANRMDYENMQLQLAERDIDLRVFCDLRMMEADQLKRTALPVHGVLPRRLGLEGFGPESLFHPKVIFLEDKDGRMVLGAGSANLSVSGWGRNQEVFCFHTVSNNKQYQQIKRFFEPLFVGAGLSKELGVRRQFKGDDEGWRFAHSFEGESFLELLLADTQAERMTVWSPYFSLDLAGLIEKIRILADRKIDFAIVPDRVGNRHVRTKWSAAMGEMLDKGGLAFHDRPSPRADEIEMTHAKLWLAQGRRARLAVGSWNCTELGTSSFELRNVEAGFLLDVATATQIAGQPLALGATDFSTDDMLRNDELDPPPYPLPFELQVSFDWTQGVYKVQGQLYEKSEGTGYKLRLPGVKRLQALDWKERRIDGAWPLQAVALELADNEALLADHSYEVWRGNSLEYRGLVLETGLSHRRAQGYDSLKDLLNDWVEGVEPSGRGKLRLRPVLRNDDVPDDELALPAIAADAGGLSYFRVFHAFEQFRQRLREVDSRDILEMLLFVQAGSLQELVAKVNAQAAAPGSSAVFNWFLLQETDSLYAAALEAHARTRAKYARSSPPENAKWQSLKPDKRLSRLPPEIRGNAEYMRQLRKACGYGR
ncbi:MAG: hypothetical protein JNM01_01375 [Delftia acidovorans]|uniref:hypothetical protein n=1 Tax=Polaromonas sp. TaxID=1869339 RepID=UPI001A576492|nr:hypothetical protein [Delftia acidovorans]